MRENIECLKTQCGWHSTKGSARKWWLVFEAENVDRPRLVQKVLRELKQRNATITEFFLAYCCGEAQNIQANLDFLDYAIEKAGSKRPLSIHHFSVNWN